MGIRHRWLQFSLGTFLLAVTVLCVWLGIVANRATTQQQAIEDIERLGGSVEYGWQYEAGLDQSKATPPAPSWLRDSLGDDYFDTIAAVWFDPERTALCDSDLKVLCQLPDVRLIWIAFQPISNAGLETLGSLQSLEDLDLYGTRISDAGLQGLSGLKQLREINVGETQVTVAGLMQNLAPWRLTTVTLSRDQIEAAGGWEGVSKDLPGIDIRQERRTRDGDSETEF